jgi:hypothetical protein
MEAPIEAERELVEVSGIRQHAPEAETAVSYPINFLQSDPWFCAIIAE